MNLNATGRELVVASAGYKDWVSITTPVSITPIHTLVVVIDPWNIDSTLTPKIPALNAFLDEMRTEGAVVCFSPYGAESLYRDNVCRKRVTDVVGSVNIPPPIRQRVKNVARPIKVSHGSGFPDERGITVFGRRISSRPGQTDYSIHEDIIVDDAVDIISFDPLECIKYFHFLGRPVENLVFCGMHLNWCILNRPIGIEEWARLGLTSIFIKRDAVASTNDPEFPPYLSHQEADNLYFRYIESFWGKTI
jgi:hypothetical protein